MSSEKHTADVERDKELITLREAEARGYGGRKRLLKLINDGVLSASRYGGRTWRVRVSDLEALGASSGVVSTSESGIECLARDLAKASPHMTDVQREMLHAIIG